jgi:hypothetical protein
MALSVVRAVCTDNSLSKRSRKKQFVFERSCKALRLMMEGGMKSAGTPHQLARDEGDLREMSSSDTSC